MRLIIYDANPGPGFTDWFLKLCWAIGAHLQVILNQADECYGAKTWDEAFDWIDRTLTVTGGPRKLLSSLQYWGHGAPGTIMLGGRTMRWKQCIDRLFPYVRSDSLIWWRVCSAFKGKIGHTFAQALANGLICHIAGHTRIIGIIQGGLHTIWHMELPSWSVHEGEPIPSFLPGYLRWGPNSVLFTATKIPDGW